MWLYRFLTALSSGVSILSACIDGASMPVLSKTTGLNLPQVLTDTPEYFSAKRLLRGSTKQNEDRVINAGIEKLTGLIKAGVLKLGENVDWRSWLLIDQSATDILTMFRLEKGLSGALTSPGVKAMERYLTSVNRHKQKSVIGVFSAHYGDDAVETLVTVQRTIKTEEGLDTIRQLRNAQLSGWLKSDRSVDDVFTLLKLEKYGYGALASPKMEVLEDYINLFK
ncbi:hypothetical protein GN244_ATG15494 [Phytophthora infestans]|uniref:Secreted RxLR effector peptide protein n=1 Tax=Phytophthora infestans TaxID=4787 RepID=A0A833RT50_PHYIN|nr:hypothetical protein GN244_ATG15494 [Phytophthora infestans]